MPTITTGAGEARLPATRERRGSRGWFFQAYAGLMLLAVLIGFSRTFFLRA